MSSAVAEERTATAAYGIALPEAQVGLADRVLEPVGQGLGLDRRADLGRRAVEPVGVLDIDGGQSLRDPRAQAAAVAERGVGGSADDEAGGDRQAGGGQLFAALSWVPVGEEVARAAGSLAQHHRRAHSGIDDADYLIAATALLLDAELLTTNVRHFPMIAGLEPAY